MQLLSCTACRLNIYQSLLACQQPGGSHEIKLPTTEFDNACTACQALEGCCLAWQVMLGF